ncbi:MAG: helix-turn-helix transcriptional regulator [Ilumatobacteraceae bacterium]
MGGGLTLRRVQGDVDVLARSGLDTATFIEEFLASVSRALPHVAACVATLDPATHLLTGTYKFGDLFGNDDHDIEWAQFEYGMPDGTSFIELIERDRPVAADSLTVRDDPHQPRRSRDFIQPTYGYGDELRMAGRQGSIGWGALALFRGADDPLFTPADVDFVATLSSDFAAGLRSGLLVRLAERDRCDTACGPAVVIVGPDGHPKQLSVGAEALLREMSRERNHASADGTISGLVAGARRYAAGLTTILPRTRVRVHRGRWLVLHASPLAGAAGDTGDVVVTIEEARPPEIVPLVVAAFELTARERDVTQLVVQGVETKQIAEALHMSRYTVQDHLKSVFDKADVRSRRELISRIYFDQYAPRMNSELAPSGWFTSA